MSTCPGDLSVPSFSFLGLVFGGGGGYLHVVPCCTVLVCFFALEFTILIFACIIYLLFFFSFWLSSISGTMGACLDFFMRIYKE